MNARNSHRVLVVDDEPSIVDAVATALRYEGYEVEEAASGREALAAAERFEPDLIVLDWMLPDIEGIEAARGRRRLRHQAVQPRRDRRARRGDPPPHGRRAARRRPALRRPRPRRGPPRGLARR